MDTLPVILFQFGVESAPFQTSMPKENVFLLRRLSRPGIIRYRGAMWLNQQTIDAIRIMAELATRWPRLARASDLVAVTGISFVNIQKTVHALAIARLLETSRGRHGGIRLARAPDEITMGEIVRAFEPKDCPVSFLMAASVSSGIANVLFKAHRGFFAPLEATTLADLDVPALAADGNRRLEA
jgi:Rrf2 family nitric oxide-sensitive transcriptional repressor